MQETREGVWLEAIALFETVREGDHRAAATLLATATNRDAVMLSLLRLLGIYLRGEDGDKLDRFLAASHRAGPPPPPGTWPMRPASE